MRLLKQKSNDDDLFSVGEKDKLEAEMRNIKRILKELYDKREKKIIEMAINRSRTGSNIIDTSALLIEEKKLYEQLVGVFDKFRTSIFFNVAQGRIPYITEEQKVTVEEKEVDEKPEDNIEKIRVRIINAVPKFINKDLKVYGPFESGAEIELEKSLAELLVEKKRAEFLP